MQPPRQTPQQYDNTAHNSTPGSPPDEALSHAQTSSWPQRMSGWGEVFGALWVTLLVWLGSARDWLAARGGWLRQQLPSANRTHDPAAAMFSIIRRRLTLWYCGALALLLLLSGVGLYQGTQYALMNPIMTSLADNASDIARNWQQIAQANIPFNCHDLQPPDQQQECPISPDVSQRIPYIVCFVPISPNTVQAYVNRVNSVPQAFYQSPAPAQAALPAVAQAALNSSHGMATDRVVAEHGMGEIQRYALVVFDPDDHKAILGIVMVGLPVHGQLAALHDLFYALLIVGALTLLGAAISGLILAHRAMAPARLALERQQSFIADASHELRTPLTLMRADAEVLLRGRNRLPPDDAELLEDIVSETAHMSDLTTNLLTLARLDAGALHVERELIDLSEIATQTIRRAQALASERSLTLDDLTQPTDRPTLVVGDRALLERAALILVDNAIKYTQPGGGASVQVARVGWQATLTVSDNGPGVEPEHLARLSERFYRVDKARSREMGGAGLGLAIARGIAETHKGTLSFESAVGQGLTATLTLPAATQSTTPTPSGEAGTKAPTAIPLAG